MNETDILSPDPLLEPMGIEYPYDTLEPSSTSPAAPGSIFPTENIKKPTTTRQPSFIPNRTPQPSPIPTQTSQPTPTSTLSPSQIVLILFGLFSPVDNPSDVLLGGNSPVYVLYLDGTLLVRGTRLGKPGWYMQKQLEPYQMCAIINRLKGEGFFKFSGDGSLGSQDPIYNFKEPVVFDPSTPYYILQINGEPNKLVTIQAAHTSELVWAMRQSYLFFKNERPGGMQPYLPERLLLWIEPGRGSAPQGLEVQSWPHNLPGLATLSAGSAGRRVVLEGQAVQMILRLFDQHPGGMLFSQFGNKYYVAARPLLPHETLEHFAQIPTRADAFPLPFDCAR